VFHINYTTTEFIYTSTEAIILKSLFFISALVKHDSDHVAYNCLRTYTWHVKNLKVRHEHNTK